MANRKELGKIKYAVFGIGGTLAPASVVPRDRSVPQDVEPVLASEIAQAIPG